jgi:hypothetical protein
MFSPALPTKKKLPDFLIAPPCLVGLRPHLFFPGDLTVWKLNLPPNYDELSLKEQKRAYYSSPLQHISPMRPSKTKKDQKSGAAARNAQNKAARLSTKR